MKVLITGFAPFGGESINPAYEAVRLLDPEIGGFEVINMEVPTVFYKSIHVLEEAIEKHQPEIVICVGQAGGRTAISLERVAINVDDARIADNEGNQLVDVPIVNDGPAAYFSTLPIKAICKAIQDHGIPAAVSNTAGTYVCNHIMYGLLHLVHTKYRHIRGGFIHVPFIETQVIDKNNMASMNLKSIIEGLKIAIETTIKVKEDIIISQGTEC